MIEGGLEAAIERWDLISRTAKNYDFTLDDWLNDMDLRDIIAGAMAVAGPQELKSMAERLSKADHKLREATVETGSIWGSAMTGEMTPDPETAWWYYRRPSEPGETMQEDLDAAGLK